MKKILIIKPSALGDIVHSLPFLHAQRRGFPHAEIDWLVARGLHTFLEGHPLINKLWVINKDQWKDKSQLGRTLNEIWELKKGLGSAGYDVAIDLSGLFRSGLFTWFSKAPVKLGFKESDEGSPFFYTHKIHGSMEIHAIDRYLKIAEFMGCPTDEIVYPLAPHDPAPAILKELPGEYIVMSPSAGKKANRWPAERYGELASRLPLPCVVIASAGEADVADTVVEHAKGNAISLAGKTSIKSLLPLIGGARFFICNDTGPMHIAAALNVPVFAIFGPANPIRTGPYGDIHTIIQKPLDCSPCYAHGPCKSRNWECMQGLDTDQVHGIIAGHLKGLGL
ncbi:MAG: glycosyltransferase family 9 protein [Desulfobacterales bacterium]|nr:glycosyltransferase family 9 protein [Desulfobacterales bacterium]